jgi:hypothetical protein
VRQYFLLVLIVVAVTGCASQGGQLGVSLSIGPAHIKRIPIGPLTLERVMLFEREQKPQE